MRHASYRRDQRLAKGGERPSHPDVRNGPRGKRQRIVGEELIRLPDGRAHLYEKLACGHFVKGVYNEYGESCSVGGMSVQTRICRQCLSREPAAPPGEIVGE